MMQASSDYRESQHNCSDHRNHDSSDENKVEVVDWSMSNQNDKNNNDHRIDVDRGQ